MLDKNTTKQIQDNILLHLLTFADAIFLPHRKWKLPDDLPTVLYEHRRDYSAKGVLFSLNSIAGTDSDVQKRYERVFKDLVDDGLVYSYKNTSKATRAKLTVKGYQTARYMAGLPTIGETAAFMVKLKASWMAEISLFEFFTEREELWELLSPGLTFGAIESNSTSQGLVYYRLTGRQMPQTDNLEIVQDENLNLQYYELLNYYKGKLKAGKPTLKSELGLIPLSCCIGK